MRLDGLTVLVTGAARGIGRATALALADAGARVGVTDISPAVADTAAAIRDTGVDSAHACFDVADATQVRAGFNDLHDTLGDFGALVNAAAIVDNIAPIATMAPERWERELAVNLTGAFNLVQAVLPAMIDAGFGRIVVISSGAAHGGLHNQVAYAASKAGLLGLVQTVTLEHARHGITANVILPGLVETELVAMMPAEIRDAAVAATPAGRPGKMEEVAALITFLVSGDAGFINGAEIDIDGGLRLNTTSLGSRRHLEPRARSEIDTRD